MIDREKALFELEKVREQLLYIANNSIDTLKARLESGEEIEADSMPIERIYPLTATPSLFKCMKPTAVIFGEERIEVKKWQEVYRISLRRCDAEKHDDLMSLRNKIAGRSRVILSDKPDGMNRPTELAEGLYAEGFFDTEWLIRIMTREIMDAVGYDYSDISIALVQGKRGIQ